MWCGVGEDQTRLMLIAYELTRVSTTLEKSADLWTPDVDQLLNYLWALLGC